MKGSAKHANPESKKALLYTGEGLCLLFGTNLICPCVVSAAAQSITLDDNDLTAMAAHQDTNKIIGGKDAATDTWTVHIGSTGEKFTRLHYFVWVEKPSAN